VVEVGLCLERRERFLRLLERSHHDKGSLVFILIVINWLFMTINMKTNDLIRRVPIFKNMVQGDMFGKHKQSMENI